MDFKTKPAYTDKTLGAALGAAAAIIGYSQGLADVVQVAAFIGASLIVTASIVGRFLLRRESVQSTAIAYGDRVLASQELPELDESQEGYDDDA